MSRYSELLPRDRPQIVRAPTGRRTHGIELNAPVSDPTEEVPLGIYLRALWRRKSTVLGLALFGTALMGLMSLLVTPGYEGVATVGIYRENQGLLTVKQDMPAAAASEDSDYTVALDTQAKIIEGEELTGEVIRRLGLDRNPEFFKGMRDRILAAIGNRGLGRKAKVFLGGGDPNEGSSYKAALARFHDNLRVVKVPHTRLLEIRFVSSSPELAADIANALADAYIEHAFRVRRDTTMQASKRLSQELRDLQEATDRSEAKLIEYQRNHQMVGADELINSRLADLNKSLTDIEVERTQKETEYILVRANKPDRVEHLQANGLLEQLRNRESQLSTEYAKLTSVMGPANPQLIEVKNQLDDVRGSIANELNRMTRRVATEYQAILRREAWLRNALEQEKRNAAQNNEDAIEYNNLKRDADTNRQLYTDLLQKLKEAQLAAGLRADNIRIEALAPVPQKPATPDVPFNLGLGLFGGLVGGIALAMIREELDSSVRNAGEAQNISGAPALGMIPKAGELAGTACNSSSRLLEAPATTTSIARQNSSVVLESYRALRSLVLLAFSHSSPRVLLVTSPMPGEGKTTTATNIASAFAQHGRRVVLVDGDLRRSATQNAVDPPVEGLSTVLQQKAKVENVLLHSQGGKENLFVLPSGPAIADPTELFEGHQLRRVVETLKDQFDYIIVDSPPVLGVTDTLLMVGSVDAVLLVVRESSTPKQALSQSRELLDKANAPDIGVVLNGVDRVNLSAYHSGYGPGAYHRRDSGRMRA